jgi:hypothetical protein
VDANEGRAEKAGGGTRADIISLRHRRRNVLRKTWMPTKGALKKLEEEHGLMVRFVIGYSNLKSPDALDLALDEESRLHGDIIRVQHQDTYDTLSTKTMLFFSHFR